MLHLVRVSAPRGVAAVRTESLPSQSVTVAVRCWNAAHVDELTAWRAASVAAAGAVLCVVAPRDPGFLRALVHGGAAMDAVVFADELHGGETLPPWAVARLMERGWVGEICGALCGGGAPPDPVVVHLVAAALEGRNVATLARRLGMSEATLRRRMHEAGLPAPKELLRRLRLLAVERQVAAGTPLDTAVHNCGWSGTAAYYLARRRAASAPHDLPRLDGLLLRAPGHGHG